MRKLVTGLCAALMALASVPAFANTTTTNYSLNKPTIGADSNNWGNLTNANWDSLDSIVFGIQGTANAACPKAGCTFTGSITVPGMTATGKINWAAAAAGFASANCPNGAAPSSKATGDIWCVSGVPHYWDGATDHSIAFLDSNVASATRLQTAQTIGASGDVNCTGQSFNGTAGITLPCTLPNITTAQTVGDSSHVAQVQVNAKGQVTGLTSVAIASQLPSQSGNSGALLSTNGSSPVWASRANAYFSTCSTSGCTLVTSNGISGVSRNSTGNFFVTFSPNLPDGNYTMICNVGGSTATVCMDYSCPNNGCTHLTNGIDLGFFNSSGVAVDPAQGFNILIIHN